MESNDSPETKLKWNQVTALRFQTGGAIRHPQPPSGETLKQHQPPTKCNKQKQKFNKNKTNNENKIDVIFINRDAEVTLTKGSPAGKNNNL